MKEQFEKEEDLLGRKLDLLLRTGQLLIQSLADSNRVDRNLRRVAKFLGIPLEMFQMHISYTTLMINVSQGGRSLTKFRKCLKHGVDMSVISGISNLSYEAIENHYSIDQFEERLEEIASAKKNYSRWMIVFGIGLACAGFCKLFGCDWMACLITMIASSVAMFVRQELHHRGINLYLMIGISAFVSVTIACIGSYLNISTTPHHPIFASVLFLIPGVPLINSVDDMLDGFTIIGVTRAVIAFFTIGAISFGMIGALELLRFDDYGAVLTPDSGWFIIGFAAMVAAAGFAMLFNVPKKTILICAFGGVIAVLTRNLLQYHFGISLPFASFIGALLVSIIGNILVQFIHVPAKVISVPPVIPMIPGVLMYKSMIGVLDLNYFGGKEQVSLLLSTIGSCTTATLTILFIALGVTIPNVIARKYIEKGKRRILMEPDQGE